MDPNVIISMVISALALVVSGVTAWLTLLRKGQVEMTQPAVVYFGPDGGRGGGASPKIFLRALLYSTSRRGRVVQNMYVKACRGETAQSFNIWVYGNEGLKRGSGLFVGHEGVAYDHHFLLPADGTNFEFLPGRYRLDVYASLVGDHSERRLWSITLDLPEREAAEIQEGGKGVYFDWGPDSKSYFAHTRGITPRLLPDRPGVLPAGLRMELPVAVQHLLQEEAGDDEFGGTRSESGLIVTPGCGELPIWSRPMGTSNVSGKDLMTTVFAKPHFAYIAVKNHGRSNLHHLNAETLVDGTVDKLLGQWVVEGSGDFIEDQLDGITLNVGLERLLLLAVAFPENDTKRWYRVVPGTPKKLYIDSTAVIASGNVFDQNPVHFGVHLWAEGVHKEVHVNVSFDSEGQPCLMNE